MPQYGPPTSSGSTAGLTLTGNTTISNTHFTGGRITANAVYMTSNTANLAAGNYFKRGLSANMNLTFSNIPANATVIGVTFAVANAGAYTFVHPANTIHQGNIAPTLTANGTDILHYTSDDGGKNWILYSALNFKVV